MIFQHSRLKGVSLSNSRFNRNIYECLRVGSIFFVIVIITLNIDINCKKLRWLEPGINNRWTKTTLGTPNGNSQVDESKQNEAQVAPKPIKHGQIKKVINNFFADDDMDLFTQKFFAAFTFKTSTPYESLRQFRPKVRKLKDNYANMKELLDDIKDLPSQGGVMDRMVKYFANDQWNKDQVVMFCRETDICETCPEVDTSMKKLCDYKCAWQSKKGAANNSLCDMTKQSGCPDCNLQQVWCPQVPEGASCPPKPICPANLCEILDRKRGTLIASSRSVRLCLNQTRSDDAMQAARCKWVLNPSKIELSQVAIESSQRIPRSDNLANETNVEELTKELRQQAEIVYWLLRDVQVSTNDWPTIMGRAFERTIGSFMELVGTWANTDLFKGRQETNTNFAAKLFSAIQVDMIRRLCRCPVCDLFGRDIKCDCRQPIFVTPQQKEPANKCRKLTICRPCRAENHCPSPLGCPRQPMCQDCADIKLNELGEDHPEMSYLFDDLDLNDTMSKVDLETSFVMPEDCNNCDDFRACGKAPLNIATFSSEELAITQQKQETRNVTLRIISGSKAPRANWPFFVYVRTKKPEGTFACGAVLISRRLVLTAGHCISLGNKIIETKNVRVTTGKYMTYRAHDKRDPIEKEYLVTDVCRLKKYWDNVRGGVRYDMALLTLKTNVTFNDYVQPACLPRNLNLFSKTKCYLMGLGKMGSFFDGNSKIRARDRAHELQELQVKRVSCNVWSFSDSDRSRHCFTKVTGPGDSCDGDSGSPIMCRNELGRWAAMGLVSYGSPDCAGDKPHGWVGVYSRVPALLGALDKECKLFSRSN